MGLLTWIVVAVVILAVIGLGAGVFFSGLIRGAQIVGENPAVQNATQEAGEFVGDRTQISNNDVLIITTNQAIYSVGDPVIVTVRNNGDSMMEFSDSALGLEIENVDTGQKYSIPAAQVITELEPDKSKAITWNSGDAEPGDYTATVRTTPPNEGISAQVGFEIR